ncbi:hypothetical protein SmJEL517_g05698 [Synchytrium microbalum]|uniref:UDP-glucose:glycoprotein glucosyltransferase n=1 Tax=Synchytrium microbalum TaxID=1806994 RepID=A0A507BYF0_9FUNG|nr:uncharacterized protein SmJEL517_g05698 [Synchytrium microbalum]TPX30824.1 hypothetical protein SmJEL517_g05698 [Synchytrium microbalum]
MRCLSHTSYLALRVVFLYALPTLSHPAIQTWLTTPWKAPPLLPQIAEFISRDNTSALFPFLTLLSESSIYELTTPKEVYHGALKLLADDKSSNLLSGPAALDLLKLSLSLHEFAPAIEAHFQYYESTVVQQASTKWKSDCRNWVDWYGTQYCDVESFSAVAMKKVNSDPRKLLPIDHVYTAAGNHGKRLPTAILYADLTTGEYLPLHIALTTKADNGLIFYVLRYRPPPVPQNDTLYVSGYGVELAIKSTEYLVTDDRNIDTSQDQTVLSPGARSGDGPVDTEDILSSAQPTIQVLKADEIADLSLKASQYVMTSSNPFDALQRVSQDFPRYAHLIAATTLQPLYRSSVTSRFQEEESTTLNPDARVKHGISVNGLELDLETINAFQLLRTLKSEHRLVSSLVSLGFTPETAIDLLSTIGQSDPGADATSLGQMFDVRSDAVFWWNDLAKDKRYLGRFQDSVQELLRPSFPGQMKYIRKNFVSTIYAVNLAIPEQLRMVLESLAYIDRDIPIRMGIVPVIDTTDETNILVTELVLYALHHETRKEAKALLQALLPELQKKLPPSELATAITAVWSRLSPSIALATVKQTVDGEVESVKKFMSRLGINAKLGAIFVNGVYLDADEAYQQKMVQTYFSHIDFLIRKVMEEEITDETDPFELFMDLPSVNSRRNEYIFISDTFPLKMVDVAQADDYGVIDNLKYLSSSYSKESGLAPMSIWLVADFTTNSGAQLALNAIKSLKSADRIRIAFLHNGASSDVIPALHNVLALAGDALTIDNIESYIMAYLEEKKPSLPESAKVLDTQAQNRMKSFILDGLSIAPESVMIVINGRVVGPLTEASLLNEDDFHLLVNLERKERAAGLWEKIQAVPSSSTWSDSTIATVMLKVQSVVAGSVTDISAGSMYTNQKSRVPEWLLSIKQDTTPHLTFLNSPASDAAYLRVLVVIDPASHAAQKISAILNVLKQLDKTHVEVRLAPVAKLSQAPVKRFYRYLIDAEPAFDDKGYLEHSHIRFDNMPMDPLLTLGYDVPNAWVVSAISCKHDLDNIKLSKLDAASSVKGVEAIFELKHILVEGHARDLSNNQPPRGLQFILGTPSQPDMEDTITMSNLGYLQLKAFPGVLDLRIRPGRSRDLFEMVSAADSYSSRRNLATDSLLGTEGSKIAVSSFEGVTLFPVVTRKAGMEYEDVLQPDEPEKEDNSMWKSIKGSWAGREKKRNGTAINIFSVASGHLYERFMGIMMVSVIRNTHSPVKFWLIADFLSPSFKDFVPLLAEQYHFDYEFVTYKWPHWLRAQTEKQRTIWGYKILFLDVLFPLSLEKVIFVDADQVVRTDLKELMELDLKGRVYAYTPFCASRTEMDGFRFWKQGYWASHLNGKPYHISALYVIDLVRFRQQATGDRLRQSYQMLSADPNSLANLDQDLPNNMQHQIPIFSLPQEWLWCETWCSDEELKTAKTIDLCNNPLTKEPKLDRARRILPEWEGIDNEVREFAEKVKRSNTSSERKPAVKGGTVEATLPDKDEL